MDSQQGWSADTPGMKKKKTKQFNQVPVPHQQNAMLLLQQVAWRRHFPVSATCLLQIPTIQVFLVSKSPFLHRSKGIRSQLCYTAVVLWGCYYSQLESCQHRHICEEIKAALTTHCTATYASCEVTAWLHVLRRPMECWQAETVAKTSKPKWHQHRRETSG